ncbi:MAG: transglutaminase-like domain-containing protein [Vicinamibacterales bacterium]|jgi:regulator of sirC expression with transglutaminase-like and TPR domain|nr:hypothetical protein [Acidobacteriota bacterium]MDP6372698.1 transglutaminase-like domain-containing protein [Vicinamibacterales bacterium]MDP6608699.1 transglutaminase-like domain-containing protein [Vicinamibacterales bacterium]HAK54077.1 hypothetical protein [Acidobacteriota bacterium]
MVDIHQLARDFTGAASSEPPNLARAALLIGRLEYPRLDPEAYLSRLDRLGEEARQRLDGVTETADQFEQLAGYLFQDQGFTGNRDDYEDPRNSCLHHVLERRTGIPVTLALVFLEVARRAGVDAAGVGFPGRFLVRSTADPKGRSRIPLIIDPFDGGRRLNESDCRELLRQHLGDDAEFDLRLLDAASPRQMLVRVLGNLKRMYVRLRSFPQARGVTELLLAVNPAGVADLRDRGLLAYHMRDFSGALRDLEAYLHITGRPGGRDAPSEHQEEHAQIWEHIKMLRRRVASLN